MLETAAIPMLLKAVDFLFGEGSKILQERRERRLTKEKIKQNEKEIPPTVNESKVIHSKDVILAEPILESNWLDSKAKVEHLLRLLEIHTKNYYLAQEKYAKWGSELAPAIIVHSRDESENEIAKISKELQDLLSEVYAKKIAVPEVEEI
jgi:hypothetical protein